MIIIRSPVMACASAIAGRKASAMDTITSAVRLGRIQVLRRVAGVRASVWAGMRDGYGTLVPSLRSAAIGASRSDAGGKLASPAPPKPCGGEP